MTIGVLINPAAGSGAQAESLRGLVSNKTGMHFIELDGAGSCDEAVALAIRLGCDIIAAAGGDGTVNEVLNALIRSGSNAALGVVPIGTGNDLARTLALGPDPLDAMAELALGRVQQLDLMQVTGASGSIYGINAASGGFSGDVDEAITAELKATFGALAYVIGAVSALPSREGYALSISFDGEPADELDAIAVIVANGRTVAGGRRVAPFANPQDGLLDVVVVKSSTLLALADVSTRLVAGTILGSNHVAHRLAGRIEISAEPGMLFNVDGEFLKDTHFEIRVLPRAMPVAVGAAYSATVRE